MKKMDSIGLRLCSYQASLFEKSSELTDCSSAIFIRRFMNSDLANRMDESGFLFGSTDIADSVSEINDQYGESTYGKVKYTKPELYWIGYIYRYWAYTSEKSSRQIYRVVKPDHLRKLYLPYHSLDPQQAIDRINEETGHLSESEMNDISRCVEIMLRVRRRLAEKKGQTYP